MSDSKDLLSHPEHICETERHREMCRLDAYYRGTQYDGRPDWWTGYHANQTEADKVPLRERKPCIIYSLPKTAVNQAVRFTVGEGRFPTIAVDEVDADEAVAPGLTITEDEATALTDYIARCIEASQLKTAMRRVLRQALSQRTSVGIVTLKRGVFVVDTPRAQDCYAEFRDEDPSADVTDLRWCYPFDKTVEEHGRDVAKKHFYRRDVTDQAFVVYEDAPSEYGKEVEWHLAAEQPKPHGFGFCPAVWMRNLPESFCGDVDGVSLYDGLEDEFDALNFTLSQRHRGIHYYGAPQAYETGVTGDDKTAPPMGRTARTGAQEGRGRHPAANGPFGVNTKAARKVSPDSIWSFESADVELDLLETSGKAFEVASKHVDDIRGRLLETMSVVIADAAMMQKSDLSGVALAKLFSPLLALVDELREHWWTHGICALISMMLRITAVTGGKGIYIPGAAKAAQILKRFLFAHEDGVAWIPPRMTPTWGDYFSPSNAEIKQAIDAMATAKEKRLVTGKTATAFIAPYVGVADAEAEAEEAEEGADTAADALENARAELLATPEQPDQTATASDTESDTDDVTHQDDA